MPPPLPATASAELEALHTAATDAMVALDEFVESFDDGGFEFPPVALPLLRSQIELFRLSVLLDHWFEAAGGTSDGAGLWSLPPDAPLAPILGARNAVIHFQAVVLPAVLRSPTGAAARAVFIDGEGCDLAAELASGIAALIEEES